MKTTKIKNPAAYLRRAEHNRIANEVKHDKTRQRQFELAFFHYDWEEDFEQHRIFEVDNSGLGMMDRRDFSLLSPADQVQFNLDFEYYEELLRRTDTTLLAVFQAAFCGFSYRDIGMKKDSWRRKLQQIEKILRQEA